MASATYHRISCKTALTRVSGMPFRWSLNPYRGCTHACHYCYARATYPYLGLNASEDFETQVFVKDGLPERLAQQIARPSWRRERIAIGTATDPYQPAEGVFRLTRRVLEILHADCHPWSLITKSTLIQRDLDLIGNPHDPGLGHVYVTITTLDRQHARNLEPGVPPPDQRLKTVQRLSEAGVQVGVLMAPVIPGINDHAATIETVAAAAKAHGAQAFSAGVLRLMPVVRGHWLAYLQGADPALARRYQRHFPGVNAPSSVRDRVADVVANARDRLELGAELLPARPAMRAPGQLILPFTDE